jgi:two-component system, OmpR family, phosphate regulon sensor histidine kinase PhoR
VHWLLNRIVMAVVAVVFGGLAGHLIGNRAQVPLVGEMLGGACAIAILALLDTLRGRRLIKWLRGSQLDAAPRDTGFWGEISYRVERSVRQHERETASERLRLTQFLSAIEASPNGVMLLDAGDHIEWCNPTAADHFGLDPKRDVRQRVTNLVRAPAFVAYLQRGEFNEPVQFAGPRRDATLSVLIRRYGEDMKIVLSQDVTAHERADAMRRDFVANVSHEIRTPLTVLTGFIETMNTLTLPEVERRRVLELMTQQAHRMGVLVSDLLVLAQLEGSPRPSTEKWVPLAPMMTAVEAEAKALSGGRHRIGFGGAAGISLAGAESELLSAIGNIVANAVRYTPADGSVDVAWRVRNDGSAEVAVTDTGPGIAREHWPRLTERFYRVDSSRSRESGGTGLGLSIVKHVMQRHGGELDIQSELGKGSCFRLVFPPARTRESGDNSGTVARPGDARPPAPDRRDVSASLGGRRP